MDKFGRPAIGSSFNGVTRTYVHANFREENMEKNLDFNNTFKGVNHPAPIDETDLTNKDYVDSTIVEAIDDSTIVRTNRDTNMFNRNLNNVGRIQVNNDPVNFNDLVRKQYVDIRKPIISIYAEENGPLSNGSGEWSWGNGATGAGFGYPMMTDGRILRASAKLLPNSTSCVINILADGVQLGQFSKFTNQNSTVTVFNTPLEVSQGEVIALVTAVESGSQTEAIAALLIEIDI